MLCCLVTMQRSCQIFIGEFTSSFLSLFEFLVTNVRRKKKFSKIKRNVSAQSCFILEYNRGASTNSCPQKTVIANVEIVAAPQNKT